VGPWWIHAQNGCRRLCHERIRGRSLDTRLRNQPGLLVGLLEGVLSAASPEDASTRDWLAVHRRAPGAGQ